jgi:hypothetical protein
MRTPTNTQLLLRFQPHDAQRSDTLPTMNSGAAQNTLAGQILAALVLLACLGMAIWMLIGSRRQQQLRTAWQSWRQRSRAPATLRGTGQEDPEAARREAQAVIDRARRAGTPPVTREGNVLRPERFGRGRPADKGRREGDRGGEPPGPTLH